MKTWTWAWAGLWFWSILAMILSWSANHSIIWCLIHGLLWWLYVIYYVIFK